MDIGKWHDDLRKHANSLGYEVIPTSLRANAINFKHKVIYIPQYNDLYTLYTLAHEIGHCVDYKNNNFNTDRYKSNKMYRLWKEFIGWWNGLTICKLHQIPTKKYFKYAFKMWFTYVKQKS
jgi:hypothetical protein